MTPDRFEAGRGDAAAVVAVRFSSELTGRDAVLEIRREALGGLREDAVLRRLRAASRRRRACRRASGTSSTWDAGRRMSPITFARSPAVRRSIESSPTCGVYRLIQIRRVCAFACQKSRNSLRYPSRLACWRVTVQCTVISVPRCASESARRWRASSARRARAAARRSRRRLADAATRSTRSESAAPRWSRPACGRRASTSSGRISIQLAVPHQRLAADDRDVQRPVPIDERHETRHELVALVVGRGRAASRFRRGARRRRRSSPGTATDTLW